MPHKTSDFSSLMGMFEMEAAVCEIVNRLGAVGRKLTVWKAEDIDLSAGRPYGVGTRLHYIDFVPPNGSSDVGVGFICLVGYGWLKPSYPNGYFTPTQALVDRIEERLNKLNENKQ